MSTSGSNWMFVRVRAAGSPRPGRSTAVCDDPIQELRQRIAELDKLMRQLDHAGLDNVRAQLLLARMRAELKDFIDRGQPCPDRTDGTTTMRITRHG